MDRVFLTVPKHFSPTLLLVFLVLATFCVFGSLAEIGHEVDDLDFAGNESGEKVAVNYNTDVNANARKGSFLDRALALSGQQGTDLDKPEAGVPHNGPGKEEDPQEKENDGEIDDSELLKNLPNAPVPTPTDANPARVSKKSFLQPKTLGSSKFAGEHGQKPGDMKKIDEQNGQNAKKSETKEQRKVSLTDVVNAVKNSVRSKTGVKVSPSSNGDKKADSVTKRVGPRAGASDDDSLKVGGGAKGLDRKNLNSQSASGLREHSALLKKEEVRLSKPTNTESKHKFGNMKNEDANGGSVKGEDTNVNSQKKGDVGAPPDDASVGRGPIRMLEPPAEAGNSAIKKLEDKKEPALGTADKGSTGQGQATEKNNDTSVLPSSPKSVNNVLPSEAKSADSQNTTETEPENSQLTSVLDRRKLGDSVARSTDDAAAAESHNITQPAGFASQGKPLSGETGAKSSANGEPNKKVDGAPALPHSASPNSVMKNEGNSSDSNTTDVTQSEGGKVNGSAAVESAKNASDGEVAVAKGSVGEKEKEGKKPDEDSKPKTLLPTAPPVPSGKPQSADPSASKLSSPSPVHTSKPSTEENPSEATAPGKGPQSPSSAHGGGGAKDPSDVEPGKAEPAQSPEQPGKKPESLAVPPRGMEERAVGSTSNFMTYFFIAVVLCMLGYILFHNKRQIVAFIIEGRSEEIERRRAGGAKYQRLSQSEDAPPPQQPAQRPAASKAASETDGTRNPTLSNSAARNNESSTFTVINVFDDDDNDRTPGGTPHVDEETARKIKADYIY